MNDFRLDDMDDDFRPEDFSATSPIPVSSDFVARTLARIREDRERIAKDVDQLEDPVLLDASIPQRLLNAYQAPEPSEEFVESTLDRVLRDRRRPRHRELDDATLERLLAEYTPPRISTDFVERTLAALSADSTRHELSPNPVPHTRRPRNLSPASRPRARGMSRRWLFAAAGLLFGLSAFFLRGGETPPTRAKILADLASSSPAPSTLHAQVSRELRAPRIDRPDSDLDLMPLDGLLVLAEGLGGRGE
ncbi:MAG: hypothetical protein AB7I19_14375 [Planctomycetota bacterium]